MLIYPKDVSVHTIEITKFIAAQFTIAKLWNQPSVHQQMKGSVNPKEYSTKEERNYVICKKLDRARNHMLSKISQIQKDKYHMFSAIQESISINTNQQKDRNLNRGLLGHRDHRKGDLPISSLGH
jgi:hypothetical protein